MLNISIKKSNNIIQLYQSYNPNVINNIHNLYAKASKQHATCNMQHATTVVTLKLITHNLLI